MGSGESGWSGARKEPYWHPIPSLYRQMDENVGRCLSHPARSLVLRAELPLFGALGEGGGRITPFGRLGSRARQPPPGGGGIAEVVTTYHPSKDSPDTIKTLRETNPLDCLGLDQV